MTIAPNNINLNTNYRPDIDGLRAIAVLSVIIYHISAKALPGGFIGVDIFFVISGYLISQQIFREIDKDTFSIADFYRRRIKRIAPALLLVLSFTVIVTQFIFRPEDAELVAESGFWSLFSLPNVYFWLHQNTSYFAPSSSEISLLHLWSLGVEEQFYVIWPLTLILTYKRANKFYFTIAMTVFAFGSYVFAEIYFHWDSSFTYYMLPARFGELLLGAIVAQIVVSRVTIALSERIASIIAWVSVCVIICSLLFLSKYMVFPGFSALPATLATAALILTGTIRTSLPTRLLSLNPMVKIGLISYAAYLWHWPLLSFIRYAQIDITFVLGSVILVFVLLISQFTTSYIEKPIRSSQLNAKNVFIFYYIVPAGLIAILIIGFMKIDGYGMRWYSEDFKLEEDAIKKINTGPMASFQCQKSEIGASDLADPNCIIGVNKDVNPNILLWGDSNATHYIGMLETFAGVQGFSFRNIEIGSCPPLLTDVADFVAVKRRRPCNDSNRLVSKELDKYDVIVMSATWTHYQESSGQFLRELSQSLDVLSQSAKLIILIGKIPPLNKFDKYCGEKKLNLPFINCAIKDEKIDEVVSDMNEKLSALADTKNKVEYYDAAEYFCPDGVCKAYDDQNELRYYDAHHVVYSTSRDVGKKIIETEGVPFPFSILKD